MTDNRFAALTQVAFAILIMLAVFAGGMAIAQAADDVPAPAPDAVLVPATTTVVEPAPVAAEATEPAPVLDEPIPVESDEFLTGGCMIAPSAEDLAQMNAEADELALVLDEYGISYERVTDDYGFTYLEWDWENPVIESVVNSFYEGRYAPSADDLAEMKALNDALIAAFDAAGISYEVIADGDFEFVEFDWEDEAANTVAEGVYEEIFGPFEDVVAEDSDCFEEYEPSEEEVAEMQKVNAALIAAFDAAGISYEVITDGPFEYVEYDWNDDKANEIADGVYEEIFGSFEDEFIGDEEIFFDEDFIGCGGSFDEGPFDEAGSAERVATLEQLSADLTAAGVEVNYEADEFWAWLTFDLEDPAALPIVTASL